MGALYIGVEELQPQKEIKITLTTQVKKLIAMVQLKQIMGKSEHWNQF